jgi:hypothetical protein
MWVTKVVTHLCNCNTYSKLFIFIVTQDQFHVKQIDVSRQAIYKFIDNYQQEPAFRKNYGNVITYTGTCF